MLTEGGITKPQQWNVSDCNGNGYSGSIIRCSHILSRKLSGFRNNQAICNKILTMLSTRTHFSFAVLTKNAPVKAGGSPPESPPSPMNMELQEHLKPVIEDKEFVSDVREEDLARKVLCRVFAVGKNFVDSSFKQADISDCYFRNCRFIRCDFTGVKISKSNFRGSQYEECKFHYSTWEHTHLDEEFLDNCLPSEENLARDLVRSLRVNFGQIGNYPAVNKSASIEVALTGQHLFHAAYSKQSYYRSKYKGWDRVSHGFRHAKWKALDLLWGNGESLSRVVVSAVFCIVVWAALLAWQFPQFTWPGSLDVVARAFWGVSTTPPFPGDQLAALTALRFMFVGLFMAILIKRLARR
jgi:uncharacterized protein YjbI with pentapeptide repeats